MKTINDVKKFWDDRPCNIKHSSLKVGSKEYFDAVEEKKYFVEPHIPPFANFKEWSGKKVLEIGSGIGTDTINFARNGAKVTAVDLSDTSIAITKKRAEIFNLNINFYNVDAEHISDIVPIEQYDLIYSFGVIHHTPNPTKVIKEIKKYMNKNSVLKIMVYNKISWKTFMIFLKYGWFRFWKFDEIIAKYSEAQTGCPITYTYTKNSVQELLKDFIINKINTEHIFPYRIPYYKKNIYKKVWYIKIIPSKLFKYFESILGWHLCVEAVLK